MLKVNSEAMLNDYADLCAKREEKSAQVEAAAKDFAAARGYDEEKTAEFVAFVKRTEDDGLTAAERATYVVLGGYIEDVAETVEEVEAEAAEADNGEIVY